MTQDLSTAIGRVRERIARACERSGRDVDAVQLISVSKGHPVASIRAAYDAGMRVFGENYAQELVEKASILGDLEGLHWRFIGHLQRNKVKLIERARASVDTVDTLRLAEAISSRARLAGYQAELLIQVNVAREAQKSGCTPETLPELVDAVRALPNVDLRGLMTVAPDLDDPEETRPFFSALRELAKAHGLPELSMGMTHDLEQAVEEGATMLRIGTAIFGPRPPAHP